jgi:hypothetical protein
MRNISDETVQKITHTHTHILTFYTPPPPPENRALLRYNAEKLCTAGQRQAINDNTAHAHFMLDN